MGRPALAARHDHNDRRRPAALARAALIAAAGSIESEMPGLSGELSLKDVAMILAYATLMLGVCLLACVVPTRRALGVEPTLALRMD